MLFITFDWNLGMQNKIISTIKLEEMGRKVRNDGLDYLVYSEDNEYKIIILRDKKEVYEFKCTKEDCKYFFNEAVSF